MKKTCVAAILMAIIVLIAAGIPILGESADNSMSVYTGSIKITRYDEGQFTSAFMAKYKQDLENSAYPEELRTDLQNRVEAAVQGHKAILNAETAFTMFITRNTQFKDLVDGDYIVNMGNGPFNGLTFQCLPGNSEDPGYWAPYRDKRYGETTVDITPDGIQLKNVTTNDYGEVTYVVEGKMDQGTLAGTWSQQWGGVEVFGGEFHCQGNADGLFGGGSKGSATGGSGGRTALMAVLALVVLGAILLFIKSLMGKPKGPKPKDEAEEDTDGIELQLTYPAGKSPKVFTSGWSFGAVATFKNKDGEIIDLSDRVEWRGTGTFEPVTGAYCRPAFNASGANTIVLSVRHEGKEKQRQYKVHAVSPEGYAHVGEVSSCASCSHGCPSCPHPTQGPITTGSPHVLIHGKPAARVGDVGTTTGCCGSNTFEISEGDPEVLIDGRPAARIGDRTEHCGGIGAIGDFRKIGEA